jgi:L-ribulose-5-phosphate 3-epimerase
MQISFMTANYVARQIGYHMDGGWGQGDKAINEYFKPIKTYSQRLEQYLIDIRKMGFEAIDIWTSLINPSWVKDEHIDIAAELLQQYELPVVSLAGWFGSNADEFEAACQIASGLNTTILGGSTSMLTKDRPLLFETLSKYGLKLGIENHPEKTPKELLSKVGDGDGVIGVAVDTGWFGTQGYNAARAIEELSGVLMHVHLKDVLHPGNPHESCRYGEGVVPIQECVETLKRIGYTGAISIEHEPDFHDPTEDIKANLAMLKEWLQ